MTKNPTCYILVGVPGSGKSTWINKQNFDWSRTVVASTDNYVDAEAKRLGKTYSEIFKEVMPTAVEHMAETVRVAVRSNLDIVWDQTSTTVESRAKKFRMLPANYEVIAVMFRTPNEKELTRRLGGRPGKTIPKDVMDSMIKSLVLPTAAEGFNRIINVN